MSVLPNIDVQLRPMLAAKFREDTTKAHLKEDGYLLVQPKIDGMRVPVHKGLPKTRSWKTWSSAALLMWASDHSTFLDGMDGEMIPGIYHNNPESDVFRRAMSEIRAEEGGREFTYFVFDNFLWPNIAYESRLQRLKNMLPEGYMDHNGQHYKILTRLCPTIGAHSIDEIYKLEEEWLALGFEGVIVRRRLSPYKYNRATTLEGYLTKLKRFEDAEAVITGVECRYRNDNEATRNELGLTSRSAHMANLVAQDMVGAFEVHLLNKPEVQFRVGVMLGYGLEEREKMWAARDSLIGRVITFKHQGYGGGYDVPRTPVMLSFRDPLDL